MPAFKKFEVGDQLDNVMVLEPAYNLASGALGWHGSPEGSGSVSLYGGTRRGPHRTVKRVEYQSLNPIAKQVGNPMLATPLTATVRFAYMTNEALDFVQITDTRWGQEHWSSVGRLYQDYLKRDPDYVTGSYDYYCLYFQQNSNNVVAFPSPLSGGLALTGSFTVEAWVKPFLTASANHDFTIASMNRVFWFGITGSTGQLVCSSSYGSFTSSFGPAQRRWSHVSLAYDAVGQTGSFTINLGDAGSFVQSTFAANTASYWPAFAVGNQLSGSGVGGNEGPSFNHKGLARRSFHGFVGETRLWYLRRSVSQLSASFDSPILLSGTPVTGSVVRTRFNEGPLALFPVTGTAPNLMGSGTVDLAAMEQYGIGATRPMWGFLCSFNDRVGSVWHPNDNVNYVTPKALAGPPVQVQQVGRPTLSSSIDVVRRMLVLDVPAAFYGRQIQPNSLSLTCRALDDPSFGLVRTLVDDGRGNLYLSGSACSSSFSDPPEQYAGVQWNKVGNVWYGEGVVVIRDPALLDFGRNDGATVHPNDSFQASFAGQSRVPVKTLMCRLDHGEYNASNNVTFYTTGSAGERVRTRPSGSIYVSTVGVYNHDRELVAVARLADPVRKRSRDRIRIDLKLDF